VNWIYLATDKGQWRAVVNRAMNFQVLERQGMPETELSCADSNLVTVPP
jgi:hypothetical protein